ncbi:DUF3899 domain-containing protein [Desnuesiella massiliensis]|uniref:DUF3899 domain-containing protein n=1 Tax=Desnuesiella massiliensis TaxID=1650662 RepID=UPI0006E3A01A
MKFLSFFSLAFLFFYCAKNHNLPLTLNLCNAFFIMGLVYLCIAFITHIRNSGLFKSFSYLKYRKAKDSFYKNKILNNIKESPQELNSFYDFQQKKYNEKWYSSLFYKFSIPLLLISALLTFTL